jgi:hypothetical protein
MRTFHRFTAPACAVMLCAPLLAPAATIVSLSDTAPTYSYAPKVQPDGTKLVTGSTNFDDGKPNGWYGIYYPDGVNKGTDSAKAEPLTSPWGSGKAMRFSPQSLPAANSGIQYRLDVPFKQPRLYKISMNVGTCTGCSTTFVLNMVAHAAYEPRPAARTFTVTSTAAKPYTTITLSGVYTVSATNGTGNDGGSVRIFPQTMGVPIWVDDVKIEEIDANPLNFTANLGFGVPAATKPITVNKNLFGLHVNELGTHNAWPALGQEAWRLWDTPNRWYDLEASNGHFEFGTMDYYLGYRQLHKPDAAVIYTMGQTPEWATPYHTATAAQKASYFHVDPDGVTRPNCSYGSDANPAPCHAPVDLNDWDDYVKTVAQHNVGKIQYYEIWNEFDIPQNFNSSPQTMVDMTCRAQKILQAVDANIKVISPSITSSGIPALDEFFRLGGGDCVDIIAYHSYFSPTVPEANMPAEVANVKLLMSFYRTDKNKLTDKPIWNTEGGVGCVYGITCPTGYTPPTAVQQGLITRTTALQAANGVSNFDFYFMEGVDLKEPWRALVQRKPAGSNCAQTPNIGCLNEMPLTPLGKGFAKAGEWLKGLKVYSAYVMQDQGIYIYKLRTSTGAARYLVWSTAATAQQVKVPLNWAVKTVAHTDGSVGTLPFSNGTFTGPIFTLNPLDPVLLAP